MRQGHIVKIQPRCRLERVAVDADRGAGQGDEEEASVEAAEEKEEIGRSNVMDESSGRKSKDTAAAQGYR